MLEILSHQYLKNFLRDQSVSWEHIYSFGRIISKCIKNDSTYLINSEIFSSYEWLPPIGFDFIFKNDQLIFANHHVRLITIQDLLNDPNSRNLRNHRIVYSGMRI